MIIHVQPIGVVDSDEHVLFSLFVYRWDNDVMCKNCARDDGHNKLHDLMMSLSLSNGRQMPSDCAFIM